MRATIRRINQNDSLSGVGILGKLASLNLNVVATPQEKTIMAKWLVKINRTIPDREADEFINYNKNLVPHELKLKGKVSWDSTIPILSHDYIWNASWEAVQSSDELRLPRLCVAFYKCPRCNMVEPSSCGDFQTVDLDKKHKCFYCSFNSEVKLWKCQGDTRWYVRIISTTTMLHLRTPSHT